MRIFGSERMDGMLRRLGLEEGEAIVHPWINKALEKAQKKVEERNFEIRKNLLRFDDVMNDQRKVIYDQRKDLMTGHDVSMTIVRHAPRGDRGRRRALHPGKAPMPSSGTWRAAQDELAPRASAIDLPVRRMGGGGGHRGRGDPPNA